MNAFAYDCGCNLPHGKTIKTVDKLGELSGLFPAGLKALVLSDDTELKRAVGKLYRTESLTLEDAKSASPQAKHESRPTPQGIDRQSLRACDFSDILTRAKLPEDIRLVISEGEYNALGRSIASRIEARHIVIGGGNLSSYDFVCASTPTVTFLDNCGEITQNCGEIGKKSQESDITQNCGEPRKKSQESDITQKGFMPSVSAHSGRVGYRILQTPIDAVLKDHAQPNLPSGFAFVLCGLISLFDWDISSLLFEEKMCSHIFKRAQKTIARLVEAAKSFSRRSPQLRAEVYQAQLDMAEIIETKGSRLLLSGATQSAAALTLLYRHEEREVLDIYSSAFLLSPTIAKAYAAFLEKEIPFSFPPDLNLRADRMTEYLGMSQFGIYPLPPHMDIKKIRLTDYRLSVYREELLKHIYSIIRTLSVAIPLYFRLFEDDGYFLREYIGCLDSSLSIGLGSEVLVGDTLLSYMRAKGVLDRYIL